MILLLENIFLIILFPLILGSDQEKLPVTVYPVNTGTTDYFVLVVSGDGGWNVWEELLSKELVKRGVPVAGLDARKYLWSRKKPEEVTTDVTGIIKYYLKAWNKKSFILLGYSFGADIVPFIASRLQEPEKGQLSKLVLISPDSRGDFEIHLAAMLNFNWNDAPYDVAGELKKIKDIKIRCIFGEGEEVSRISAFRLPGVEVATLPGKHHFRFDFKPVVDQILK
ncbi:MAG: alpha/beta fold hydrolase [Bacteroidetes bacterium]|nr:alpha/beta fold hydrolase [Bacteroidota bacterium]